jgi:4-hydroxy-tetrahydrodipicolinate synthase
MKTITGSIVALVTPMRDDQSIDFDALRRLIDWHVAEGTQCIGVVGTTGESPTVTVEEHCEIIRLAQVPGIVGIKEATGDIARGSAILRSAPPGFAVYSGNDDSAAALMLLGGHGSVSVTANVAPRAMQALCAAALAGNAREAAEIQLRLMPLHQALFVEPSPTATKWALERLGRCGSGLRLPITPLSAAGQAIVEAALREAELL